MEEQHALDIRAGKNALQIINQNGFSAENFSTLLGASGGPKWFVLFGLDKYIFGEFFNNRKDPLDVIGSSAGAFRAACFAQKNPVAAISSLAKHYSETQYSKKPTAKEITFSALDLLEKVVDEQAIEEIIKNPLIRAHFIVAKAKGLVASENPLLQTLGLTKSYLFNRANRKLLTKQYQRYVFAAPSSDVKITDPDGFDTYYQTLDQDNLLEALLASGSIPLVMKGIRDIPGAPKGMYRDGGIIDYHFDIGLNNKKLILYPHFNSAPKSGWFDKNLNRSVNQEHYKDVVLISPSKEFVANLPYGKIPDRTDFETMDYPQRIKYWRTVFNETEKMAESLDKLIQTQDISQIKPL